MARGRRNSDPQPVEFLLAEVLDSETGYPPPLKVVRDAYGPCVLPAPQPGWFWVPSSPAAARDIRARGLHAHGTVTRTYIPPQLPIVVEDVPRERVPVIGSWEWLQRIHMSTDEQRRLVLLKTPDDES
jgi:hypothetical protein